MCHFLRRYARRSITCVWTKSKSGLYVDQLQWTLNEMTARTIAKQVHYSSEWFTTILLSAPGVQRPYLTFYPAASSSLAYPSTSEKELGFYFSTTCVKGRRDEGSPLDRFIKVVWHIHSPRLLPRPRVGNIQKREKERETRDILFYLLFHFKAMSRPSSSLSRFTSSKD